MKHAPCGVLRGLGPIATQVRCRRAYRRACGLAVVGVPLAGALITAILGLGTARESLPERAARAVPRRHGNPHSGGVGGGLRESRGSGPRACARLRLVGPMRRWRAADRQAGRRPRWRRSGARAGGGDCQRSAPSRQFVCRRRQPRPAVAARGLGTARGHRR